MTEPRCGGSVQRVTVKRAARARCLTCGTEWDTTAAMGAAAAHTTATGHYVEASYEATYIYTPTAEPIPDEERVQRYALGMVERILLYLYEHPGASAREVTRGVRGRSDNVRTVLAYLVDAGHVLVRIGPNRARQHYPVSPPCGSVNE